MRLLNVHLFFFEEFFDSDIPPYYILSHRWIGREITHKEFAKVKRTTDSGYRKVIAFCDFVKRTNPDVEWAWIDTCCIDKRSSAELSEAINSMFSWYKRAVRCIVYLSDINPSSKKRLSRSFWFGRGWTLQELIAPQNGVIFCDRDWQIIGHTCRRSASGQSCMSRFGPCETETIAERTGVPIRSLVNFDPLSRDDCVAQRMAWASERSTSRIEDEAYCLLGIFDVNMPLIYGEGSKAFLRLQREIIQKSLDQSIFAWWLDPEFEASNLGGSIFAMSPAWFQNSTSVRYHPLRDARVHVHSDDTNQPFVITNKGLELKAFLERVEDDEIETVGYRDSPVLLRLNCVYSKESSFGSLMIYVHETEWGVFHRVRHRTFFVDDTMNIINSDESVYKRAAQKKVAEMKTIYVEIDNARTPLTM